jgi:indolepyruvate ferredoxin oxidoreductase alpha subunit
LANSYAEVDIGDPMPVSQDDGKLIRDIARFTKAGPAICMAQHKDLISRLDQAGEWIELHGLNQLSLSSKPGGLGILAAGVPAAYIHEAIEIVSAIRAEHNGISQLRPAATVPFPEASAKKLLEHCGQILVLEELEPFLEKELHVLAFRLGWKGRIIGKLDGVLERVGEYGLEQVVQGISAGLGIAIPQTLFADSQTAAPLAAARPITTCAGCPHRGTFMAINTAIRKNRLKPDQVMVTGDIGCTILGINPPYNTVWNEISMGASVSLAQGFVHGNVKTPVLATIGDSTFFHGGIPGLINAIQHQVNMTLIIMDNRWTAMTGMQVNPGSPAQFQKGESSEVDIARIVPALGVEQFFTIDPFDMDQSVQTIQQAMNLPGVKVILARQECAIQVKRYREPDARILVVDENCNLCKLCIMQTGCAAISLGETAVLIDDSLCTACGLCLQVCNRDALIKEKI